MRQKLQALAAVLVGASSIVIPSVSSAQYFGRNKVQYDNFDFHILETPHFRLHFYPEEEEAARDMSRMAERWETRLSGLFSRQLKKRKPILLYANQPDFQQTNAVTGQLTEGTGGVTESLRDRLIMPLTGVYRDNDHVLGHEMVHVFQYDLENDAKQPGARGGGINSLPLWVVEGIAEYLSLGRDDPHTAMWMRDAVKRNKLPSIKQLTSDQRFFPYRYGEALWAYVGGKWGDRAVADTYKAAAKFGFEQGIKRTLGISSDSLSKEWIAATKAAYSSTISSLGNTPPGQPLLPAKRDGDTNLSPSISPDGRYIAFFAARDLFGYDLYLADATTGKSVKKLANASTSTEFDALSFLSSAGTWSPDGKKFAFIVYAKGDQEIAILDVATHNVERQIAVPGVGSIQNPAWSPDGGKIAFSGQVGGVSDLFVYDINAHSANRLTNDRYADIQPAWSPDGRTLAFTTDRGDETDFTRLTHGALRIGLIDVASGSIRLLQGFQEGKAINPQFSHDGNDIYFISDRSGISNIYRMTIASGALAQVTNVATGVSGITNLAPAFSISPLDGRIAFSVFEKQGYGIYGLASNEAQGTAVQTASYAANGFLPPAEAFKSSTVAQYLADPMTGLPADAVYKVSPYKPSLALAALGSPSIGVGTSPQGTVVGGATAFFFTDILGNRNLAISVNANGTYKDFGGGATYMNVGHRFVWAIDARHTPYASGFVGVEPFKDDPNLDVVSQYIQRLYVDEATLITQYPFSVTKRAELNLGVTHLGFNTEVEQFLISGNEVLDSQKFDTTSAPSINYASATAAFVGDNSFFGFTGPINGYRYRFEVSPTIGSLRFETALADVRKYFFARPVTLAVRGLHFGRYGADAESNRLSPVFLGDPSLVRGYSANSFDASECSINPVNSNSCPEFDRLVGSRIAVASAELRIPLLGNDQLGLLRSPLFPIDIAPFVDAGVAWANGDTPSFTFATHSSERIPVMSAGVSARANLLGYAVLEVFYAHPFQRPDKSWVLGFQLAPGW
ncbi:MAG TPA: BamA/TamA family outer membrane protein [Gemmatimonadaceae bacterium]|nr:BamA/TamA family outer membrane protein [Gemmatimonadaceae bacterium]